MTTPFVWLVVEDAFWAATAALGFAILFNVPRRALPGCAIGAAVGHALRFVLLDQGVAIEFATLLSATLIGFGAQAFARYQRIPSSIFAIPGSIPMVPGIFAFNTLIGILKISSFGVFGGTPVLVEASINATKTGLILAALAVGIAAPNLLFKRPRPVV